MDTDDLRMDLEILFRTVAVVVTKEGVNQGDDVHMTPFMGTEAPEGEGSEDA